MSIIKYHYTNAQNQTDIITMIKMVQFNKCNCFLLNILLIINLNQSARDMLNEIF